MIKQYLIFGFLISFLWAHPSQADYVCATKSLNNGDEAAAECPAVCENYNAHYIWPKGSWLPRKDGMGCMNHASTKHNYSDSVCECTLQSCSCDKDGNQSSNCDEGKNPKGANQCTSSCDCVAGRICINGWCKKQPPDKACCDQCFYASNQCNRKCGPKDWGCLMVCEIAWGVCEKGCKEGCTSSAKKN